MFLKSEYLKCKSITGTYIELISSWFYFNKKLIQELPRYLIIEIEKSCAMRNLFNFYLNIDSVNTTKALKLYKKIINK